MKNTKGILILLFASLLICSSFFTINTKNHTSVQTLQDPGSLQLSTVPGSSDPNQDEWPMFRGQLNHTGEAHTSPITSRISPFWTFGPLWIDRSSPAVTGGRLYINANNGSFYCLNATTGKYLWRYRTGSWVESSPAVADGRVYVGSDNNKVYCLNATTGKSLWNYTTGGYVYSSPAVAGRRLYVGSGDGKVYCLNATTGKSLWNYTTGGAVESSPAVVNGRVYVANSNPDSNLYCLNAITGARLWNYSISCYSIYSSPAVAGGRVYVASGNNDRKLYCLNAITGGFLWSYPISGLYMYSSPAVANGRVYVGGAKFYCLNAITGESLWNYTMGNWVESSPAVAGGYVYVGSINKNLFCLNATTGGLLWNYTMGSGMQSSPAVVGGRIYVGSNKIYCLPSILDCISPNITVKTPSGIIYYQEPVMNVAFSDVFSLDAAYYKVDSCTPTGNSTTGWIQIFTNRTGNTTDLAVNLTVWGSLSEGSHVVYFKAWDDMGNINDGSMPSWQFIKDTKPPTFTCVTESADPLELGNSEVITVLDVADRSPIQAVLLEFEGINHTMTDLGGQIWGYLRWTPSSIGNYSYTIYLQDDKGHWNATSSTIEVLQTPSNPSTIDPLIWILPLVIVGMVLSALLVYRSRNNRIRGAPMLGLMKNGKLALNKIQFEPIMKRIAKLVPNQIEAFRTSKVDQLYKEKLSCRAKQCSGLSTVPVQLMLEEDKIEFMHHCPGCHAIYKSFLPLADEIQWIPIVINNLFRCDNCGTLNLDGWQIQGPRSQHFQEILFSCKSCGNKRTKFFSKSIGVDILSYLENPEEFKQETSKVTKEPTATAETTAPEIGKPTATTESIIPEISKPAAIAEVTGSEISKAAVSTSSGATPQENLPKKKQKQSEVKAKELAKASKLAPLTTEADLIIKKMAKSPSAKIETSRISKEEQTYQEAFRCGASGCANATTIPVKIILEKDKVNYINRCPVCHTEFQAFLPSNEKDQWMSVVICNFFLCDQCGTENSDNWLIQDPATQRELKILTKCKKCSKKYTKVLSYALGVEIYHYLEKLDKEKKDISRRPNEHVERVEEIVSKSSETAGSKSGMTAQPIEPTEKAKGAAIQPSEPVEQPELATKPMIKPSSPKGTEPATTTPSAEATKPVTPIEPEPNIATTPIIPPDHLEKATVPVGKMTYQERLSCGLKACSNLPTIPTRIIPEKDVVTVIHRCPRCHAIYRSSLPLTDKDQWLPIIVNNLFRCDHCGTENSDNWETSVTQRNQELVFKCKQCGNTRIKILANSIWGDIRKNVENLEKNRIEK